MAKIVLWITSALCLAVAVHADQIVMQNGDVYHGKVVSMTTNALMVQSDVLGKITLSSAKVATIHLGADVVANPAAATAATNIAVPHIPAVGQTSTDADLTSLMRQLGSQTNLIQQVQSQFLAGAGPEANDKFNELLSGMMSGKISVDDLRTQAKTAAAQIRSVQKDLDPEASEAMDGYLAILNQFLSETGNSTNAPSPAATLSTPQSRTAPLIGK